MDFNEGRRRYAEILVKIGVELKQGQALCVEAPVDQWDFVTLIAQEAYKAGCSKFQVIWKCDVVDRVKLENQKVEVLDCDKAVAQHYAELGAGFIRLDCPDTKTFAGVPAELLNEKAIADTVVRGIFRSAGMKNGQTICCMPCQAWADLVYPDLPQDKRLEALWEAVFTCMRCGEPDPVGSWKQYIADTTRRKAKLDAKQYVSFHYKSAKTDITISPVENQKWQGGCIEIPGERVFIPNLPTVEVFTTPHKYKADGHIASTLPLNYRGQLIENFVLYLEKGRIVRFTAEKGEELLRSIIETDEGSHYLGEMAFIDQSSSIASLGRVFFTTLYDENASCHVAIGNAFGPFADPKEKDAHGYNDSKLHVDFMVGSDDMHIQGQLPDGTWEDVLVDGHWAPEFQ